MQNIEKPKYIITITKKIKVKKITHTKKKLTFLDIEIFK